MRRLLVFFALGLALFLVRRSVHVAAERERPLLVVSVPKDAPPSVVERAIDEAVLMNEALARGGAQVDPLVRSQLLRSMRLEHADKDGDDRALIDRALSLGVHRADPVIRQRLVFQAEQLLRASAVVETPSDAVLEAYRDAHRARYLEPARASFVQVYLSRDRRRAELTHDAEALRAKLLSLSPQDAPKVADPSILPWNLELATQREIDARFGPLFAEAVFAAPLKTWSGPTSSVYGLHFVYVSERQSERVPALSQLRARVLADYQHDQKDLAVAQRLRALRGHYRVEVRRGGP